MRLKLISRGLMLLIAILVGASVAPGCATQDSELFIRGVAYTPPGQCVIKAEADTAVLSQGLLDLAFGQSYSGFMIWGNQLVARGSTDLVRVENNRVALDSADVSVQLTDGSEVSAFSVPTSGFADPTTGGLPGYGFVQVPLIDFKTAVKAYNAGKRTLVSKVRVFGRTLGGSDVQSNEFTYVVSLCNGCTISFSPANQDNTQPGPNCLLAAQATQTMVNTVPCTVGQDFPINCADCLTSHQACLTGPQSLKLQPPRHGTRVPGAGPPGTFSFCSGAIPGCPRGSVASARVSIDGRSPGTGHGRGSTWESSYRNRLISITTGNVIACRSRCSANNIVRSLASPNPARPSTRMPAAIP